MSTGRPSRARIRWEAEDDWLDCRDSDDRLLTVEARLPSWLSAVLEAPSIPNSPILLAISSAPVRSCQH